MITPAFVLATKTVKKSNAKRFFMFRKFKDKSTQKIAESQDFAQFNNKEK